MALSNLSEYWYLWLIFVLLILVLIFVGKRAFRAAKHRRTVLDKQEKELSEYKYYIEKYTNASAQTLLDAPTGELVRAVALILQREMEKSDNFDECFNSAALWRKQLYALDVMLTDAGEQSLSSFFRNNSDVLFSPLFSLFDELDDKTIYPIIKRMFPMLDSKNDYVSYDARLVAELDEQFKERLDMEILDAEIKEYVKKFL